MKNDSLKGKIDPKLHVRKKVAGGATGAMLGAAVAGPIGAVIGGAVGTMVGGAAEQGLEIPKRMSKRSKGTKVQARARGGSARNGSAVSMRAKRSTGAKKPAMPLTRKAARSKKGRSKR